MAGSADEPIPPTIVRRLDVLAVSTENPVNLHVRLPGRLLNRLPDPCHERETDMKQPLAYLPLIVLTWASASVAEDFAEPADAVQAYITAVSTGSGAHILRAFSDNAEIQYYNGDGEYRFYSRESFADVVDTGEAWDADIEITNLFRTGKAANATVEFTWGEHGQHGYVDYLNLIHADESWRITNKVAQYVQRD
jgi:hypothetical protein